MLGMARTPQQNYKAENRGAISRRKFLLHLMLNNAQLLLPFVDLSVSSQVLELEKLVPLHIVWLMQLILAL